MMLAGQMGNYRRGNSSRRLGEPVSDENFLPSPSASVYREIIYALRQRRTWMDAGNADESRRELMRAECGVFEAVAGWLLEAYGQDTRMVARDKDPGWVLKFRNL